ncbi:hypothetical protein [uncultured Legionella sp.]|uniref:hypothetical protein n=1 Tax=uncultured Legionella sp. TaxID=210934 RepID=UPI00262A5CF3|nr:hypothetical protein [uncultured Legionella sp.]
MNNNKSFKWGYGIVMVLALGLSGCFMDNTQSVQEGTYSTAPDYSAPKPPKAATTTSDSAKAAQKSYTSKEPTQKTTPGPKRTAAPQLPVIQ